MKAPESVADLLAGREDPDERYLALLDWVARRHPCDFADFVAHRPSAGSRRGLTREQVRAVRAHNHARQIGASPFWAVMALPAPARHAFAHELMEFVGCDDEAIRTALRALDAEEAAESTPFRRAG